VLDEKASRTALGAALYRAAHQLVDVPPVFDDPLALTVVGATRGRPPSPSLASRATREAAPLRAFVAARSRRAEDRFAEAFARGTRQYLVLGAGLDTFGCRCPFPGVRVLEVDHPATQAWKRALLERVGIAVPARLTFVPVDFERDALEDGLESALDRAGLDRAAPAFVAWLGVTPYLTPEAVRATLAFVARELAPGSEVLLDFAVVAEPEPRAKAAREAFAARVATLGEPLRSAFAPEALIADAQALGFAGVEVEDAEALNARYFSGRSDGLRLHGGHLLWAGR
jgi:methyltransferase (TIGR00027 family)